SRRPQARPAVRVGRALSWQVEGAQELLHLAGGLAPARAARRAARDRDTDLEVRARGAPDDAAADLGDRLTGSHARAHRRECGPRVAVVDEAPGERPAGDAQDGCPRPEAADAVLDDHAVGDGDLDRGGAARAGERRDVDALVKRPGP